MNAEKQWKLGEKKLGIIGSDIVDKTTQNRNESIETVPQFNGNLMIQYNEGKGYKGYRTINIFEFKNTKSDIKVLQLLKKKRNQHVKQIIYTN